MVRGISDSNLLKLYKKAVRKIFNYSCFFCGNKTHPMEVHHIVKRKMLLLRYSWRNGMLLCKWTHSGNEHFRMSCHQFAETPKGKHMIDVYLNENSHMDYLMDRNISIKQYLVPRGMTKTEYLIEMKTELEDIINGKFVPNLQTGNGKERR